MSTKTLIEHINEDIPEDEFFSPKKGKNPSREKWLDYRKFRNLLIGGYWRVSDFTENGIPIGWNKPMFRMWSRPRFLKKLRKRNGRQEFYGYGDAWSQPWIYGKSSRQIMRDQKQWHEDAWEELLNGI